MLPQKILKFCCSETPFIVFWEAKSCLKCEFAKKYSILFYVLCGFWKFSRYHSHLSILLFCVILWFENFRTDVKIGIFPIPIALWSGFGFSSKIGRIPTRSGCLDSLHRHTTFNWLIYLFTLNNVKWVSLSFLTYFFQVSTVFFKITVGHASRDRNKNKQLRLVIFVSKMNSFFHVHHQRKRAIFFDFMPCGYTFQMVLHGEGILTLSACLITNLNLMNGMK